MHTCLLCMHLLLCCRRDQLQLDQPDWDFQEFMSAHLPDYLVMSKEFMEEVFPEQQQQPQGQQGGGDQS